MPVTTRELAAATPTTRDRTVDALRAVAIAVVVLGHWTMAVVAPDRHASNLLELEPWTRRLTWLLQVMPVFFAVGGFAGAASWTAARRAGGGFGPWLHGRLRRLLLPVVPLAVAWTLGLALLGAAGVDPRLRHDVSRLAAMPLWFLAVFVGAVLATPLAVRADERWGLRVVVALGAGAALGDLGLLGGCANFGFVWLLAHQLGVAWRSGRLVPSRRVGAAMAGAGLAVLVALTTWGGYGVSLVGAWDGQRSNTDPPTLAIVAATLLQVGLAFVARPALARLCDRPAAWRAVIAANGVAMTAFCWHLTAAVVVGATGLVGGPGWWARPPWLAACAVVLGPLVAAFAPVERASVVAPRRPVGAAAAVVAGAGAVGALALLALRGFAAV